MITVDGLDIRMAPSGSLIPTLHRLHELRRTADQPPAAAVDLALAGQQVFSEIYFTFLRNLHELGLSDNLVLGGGCTLNSSANGRVLAETGFTKLHVYSAPGDDGNALGAAWLAFAEGHPEISLTRDQIGRAHV